MCLLAATAAAALPLSSQVVSVSSDVIMAHCWQMNNKADSPMDCFLIDSCENDNIHKDFRKAIGANCIFYSAQSHELIVLVSTQTARFHLVNKLIGLIL